jgi:hypothetical protein
MDATSKTAAEHTAERTFNAGFENTGRTTAKAPVAAEMFLVVAAIPIAPAAAPAAPA